LFFRLLSRLDRFADIVISSEVDCLFLNVDIRLPNALRLAPVHALVTAGIVLVWRCSLDGIKIRVKSGVYRDSPCGISFDAVLCALAFPAPTAFRSSAVDAICFYVSERSAIALAFVVKEPTFAELAENRPSFTLFADHFDVLLTRHDVVKLRHVGYFLFLILQSSLS
jgi:hypothetical protein